MLNKLQSFVRQQDMIRPGDRVICAVSGGADSMALLWAMYLLRDKWKLELEAAHYNHGLRGEESDRDERFVRAFCDRFEIPLHVGTGKVTAGEKGLEAAARTARYGFFDTLSGKLATAHTADDNAETVLMRLVRGTGLKGLGGISPVRGNIIRPMLTVTRDEVLAFLEEYRIGYVQDSSNHTDAFLRNRLRHHVMPLLDRENPRLAEKLSAMALRLRQDEAALSELVPQTDDVRTLRQMGPAQRGRALTALLEQWGVREPSSQHIRLAESLVFSPNPSASARFPGNITVGRNYGRLQPVFAQEGFCRTLNCPGVTELPELSLRISCGETPERCLQYTCFTVKPRGRLVVRSRLPGDTMRLTGGTKSLKKLFVDRKIPAAQRAGVPVIADDGGVIAVWGIGANLDRVTDGGVCIRLEEGFCGSGLENDI